MMIGFKENNVNKLIKKPAYWVVLIALLAGCAQNDSATKNAAHADESKTNPSPTDTLKHIDKTLSNAGKITKASQVKFEVFDFDYKLPKSVTDACKIEPKDGEMGCPEVQIQLAKSQPSFIADVVNRAVTNDDNPQKIKFRQSLDEFAQSQINEENTIAYYTHTTIERLPNHKNLVQIAIHDDVFLGGAHNIPSSTYLLFDMDLQSQIHYSDLLTADDSLYTLLHEEFLAYLLESGITSAEEIAEYEQMWPFEMTQNAYFNEQGLVFVYDPYQMGPFAAGFIELTVPYDKLHGTIRPQYL